MHMTKRGKSVIEDTPLEASAPEEWNLLRMPNRKQSMPSKLMMKCLSRNPFLN